jgi:hypothetical protein
VEIQNENAEQEWIAKYRAAANEAMLREQPAGRIRAALGTVWHRAISAVNRTVQRPRKAESRPRGVPVKRSELRLEKVMASRRERQPVMKVLSRNPREEKLDRRTSR